MILDPSGTDSWLHTYAYYAHKWYTQGFSETSAYPEEVLHGEESPGGEGRLLTELAEVVVVAPPAVDSHLLGRGLGGRQHRL